ncbi:biotin synthesis protein bioC [Vibrio maritimus]|uniref:Biotin synthesis protein bioC n=1 Tax=Vibrio maritimus TaxID=990268 RepID=A0A090TCM8_9VIBR|nr:biotin synthesis protein bioC [Vibrio maritimus]
MSNEWDEYAATWEKNQATAAFAQSCFEELTAQTSLTRKTVLDFGCGTGLLSQLMSPATKEIVALDGSEAMIEELDKKGLENVEPVVDLLTRGWLLSIQRSAISLIWWLLPLYVDFLITFKRPSISSIPCLMNMVCLCIGIGR